MVRHFTVLISDQELLSPKLEFELHFICKVSCGSKCSFSRTKDGLTAAVSKIAQNVTQPKRPTKNKKHQISEILSMRSVAFKQDY